MGQPQFDCTKLKTVQGLDLSIVNPGRLNTASGPDFKDAELIIDGIRWHGHVEIHIRADDWDQHGHQVDPAYGGVILHVVLNNPHYSVRSTSGTVPHTLGLEPYLQSSLAKLLKVRHSSTLPCSRTVTYLSQQAFERQIQKVHQEYFEYKLMNFFHSIILICLQTGPGFGASPVRFTAPWEFRETSPP